MNTIKNIHLRDEILAPYLKMNPYGGIVRFDRIPFEVLHQLMERGFVSMGAWNSCPGVEKLFLPFLERNPLFTVHGYAVSAERPDCRVDVEGVERVADLTTDEIIDFANTFRRADDFKLTANHARCWYD